MAPPTNNINRLGDVSLIFEVGIGLATGKQPYEHPLFLDDSHSGVEFLDQSEKISLESNGPVFKFGVTMPIWINTGQFCELGFEGGYGLSEHFGQWSWGVNLGYAHRLTSRLTLDWNMSYLGQVTEFSDRHTRYGGFIPGETYIQHGGGISGGLIVYLNKYIGLKWYFGGKMFQANELPHQVDAGFDIGFTAGMNLLWNVFGNEDMMK